MTTRGWLAVGLALAALGLGALAALRLEGGAPSLEAPDAVAVGAAGAEVPIALSDTRSGVRELSAVLAHARGEAELLRERYPATWWGGAREREPRRVTIAIDPAALDLPEGHAVLRVAVRDASWRGNEARAEVSVTVDREPPRIRLASGLTYVRRGGSGAVRYRVSEPTARDGVEVGTPGSDAGAVFYAGFPAPAGDGERVAVFAVPADAPEDPPVRVLAEDAAGNVARARWPVVVQRRDPRDGLVTLPDSFLEEVVARLARSEGTASEDPAAAFHEINTAVRARNEARIRALLADSAPEPLWRGAFQQLPGSVVTSHFAERRVYFIGPQRVSEATHFGYDLASTAAASITAANAGRVVFAGEIGIYGLCVLIDHGLGVASLYGHLSRLDVRAGDRVEKGMSLGLSGATGLAGGDHLHFAMLVGETYVDPLEWWDPEWVRTHVEARLR